MHSSMPYVPKQEYTMVLPKVLVNVKQTKMFTDSKPLLRHLPPLEGQRPPEALVTNQTEKNAIIQQMHPIPLIQQDTFGPYSR